MFHKTPYLTFYISHAINLGGRIILVPPVDTMQKLSPPPRPHGLWFDSNHIAEAKKGKGIVLLKIEGSKWCNLCCPYCYSGSSPLKREMLKNELTPKKRLSLVREAKELGAKSVEILGGEPFLMDDLLPIVEEIRKNEMVPVVFTNGTLIEGKRTLVKELRQLDTTIVAKLNVPFPDDTLPEQGEKTKIGIQQTLTGRKPDQGKKSSYERMVNGINILVEEGFNKNWRLAVESVVTVLNMGILTELWRYLRERDIIPFFELLKPVGRGDLFDSCESEESIYKKSLLYPAPREAKKLFEELAKIDREEFGYGWVPTPPIAGWTCGAHGISIYVTAEGIAQPCSALQLSIGDVKKQSLREILECETMEKLRKIKIYLKGKCRECHIDEGKLEMEALQNCYGCRATAYKFTGDPFGEDTECWRISGADKNYRDLQQSIRFFVSDEEEGGK